MSIIEPFSKGCVCHSKIKLKLIFRVSPISTGLFCYITCTFKRSSLRLFRFKISQLVPFLHIFDGFCGFLIQRGTHCEIFNLNNRRLVRLKVRVNTKKKSCTDGGNPTKKIFLSD